METNFEKPARFKHQEDLLNKSPNKYLFAWGCGCGKTRSAIELIEQKTFDVLVIVPKALVTNWKREIEKWSNGETAYHVITKEKFKKQLKELRRYDAVIVDEAHNFARRQSQQSKALAMYLKAGAIQYVYLLTATPFLTQPWNVYRLSEFLGHKWSRTNFDYQFYYRINIGGRMIPMLRKGMEQALAGYVQILGIPVTMDEAVDVPEVMFETEYFDLTKHQQKKMKEAYDSNPLVRFTREHQICGGTLKGDEFTQSEIFKSDKRERVLQLSEENDKLIVVCRYRLEIDALQDLLSDAGRKVYVLTGDVQDRDAVLQEARNQDKFVLLVSGTLSEGWECPEVSLMVFYSYSFSLKDYIQMIGRIQRINKVAKRTYLSLICKSSIDEQVFDCISKKEDFHIAIYHKELLKSEETSNLTGIKN